MTFDTDVHFFTFSKGCFHEIVVADLEALFVPVPVESLFVNPLDVESARDVLFRLPDRERCHEEGIAECSSITMSSTRKM